MHGQPIIKIFSKLWFKIFGLVFIDLLTVPLTVAALLPNEG
jgi:hypothetical protein